MADYVSQPWKEMTERWGRARKTPKWQMGEESSGFAIIFVDKPTTGMPTLQAIREQERGTFPTLTR